MSCENCDRKRNRYLNFRVSDDELRLIDAKVAVSGLAKGEYQSDRLAVELKKLREALEKASDFEELRDAVERCSDLLEEMIRLSIKTPDRNNQHGKI